MNSSIFFRSCAAAITFLTILGTIIIMFYRKFRIHEENKIIAANSSSSSSPLSPLSSLSGNRKHHVFPSFHGGDVRKNFLTHILKEFRRKGIDPFVDNNIERSKSIGSELIEAIRGSKIAIVLLSKNYASSSWCMNELVEIMKCREELGQTVMTIFYEVDPTHVKKQTGDFGKVFSKTCKGKTKEEIKRWRKALEGVAKIAGEHSCNWDNEAAMIEKIAIDVSNMLNNFTPTRDLYGLVGMGAHMEKMGSLLCLDLDEVRMIGIWGPSGIGKTTMARFLFNQLSRSFQLSTIMVNIRGCYPRPCLDEYSAQLELQNKMLSQMINKREIMISHLGVAQERLKDKKVLLVLDDVDRLGQLVALAKEIGWFGPGSRIIITTEDIRVLKAHEVNHIYQVKFPSTDEALQIFSMYAFGQKRPYDDFYGLAWEVTELAGKLPLGLKVLGSTLRGMSKPEWEKTVPRLRTCLDGEIESILKFSYDALCDEDKDLFLYIACFFNYEKTRKVENHLAKRFLDARRGIHVIAEKSLIDIDMGVIEMHNLLVQMGREIARKQSIDDPRKLHFLVDQREIGEVLSDDTKDTRRIIGIDVDLDMIEDEVNISEKSLQRIPNLQFLRVRPSRFNVHAHPDIMYALLGLNYQFLKIRYLKWMHFPMTYLPSTLNPEFLLELNMRDSKLHKLWERTKPLKNLKWVDLRRSKNLKELPNLSSATNLEELILKNCSSLVELPALEKLAKLKSLRLRGCSSLLELPSFHENVIDLQILDLDGCSSLTLLPFSIGNAINLHKLFLKDCSGLVELPFSIGNFNDLEEFSISGCSSLVELPPSIRNFTNLEELDLSGCSSLVELPSSIGNLTYLEKLDLCGCSSLVELPSIRNTTNLEQLNLTNCSSLVKLPSSIRNGTDFWLFNLKNCSSVVELPSIEKTTNLLILELINCSSLVKLPLFIGNTTSLREFNLYNCSSLVELPSFIGNLHLLHTLNVVGCSKLEVLPVGINLESLDRLDLTDCSRLKSFPEISTNIKDLYLVGTAIEEVPSSIRSWSRLNYLSMSYFESLKEFPHALDILTELHMSKDIQEVPSWIKGISRLSRFVINHCKKLVSLPQLPDSLSQLDAENCDALERLDCCFNNPEIRLNFTNCFKLNNEARELIMHTSTSQYAILSGQEMPAFFKYRATRVYLTVKLNQRLLRTSLRFKACILLEKGDNKTCDDTSSISLYIYINDLNVPYGRRRHIIHPVLTEHLYTFEVEAEEVTSTELVFEFLTTSVKWGVEECGVLQI